MMADKIRQNEALLTFRCPGCGRNHSIQSGAEDGPNWQWDGSKEAPTFSPSVLVTYEGKDAGQNGAPYAICHSFVRSGKIEYLGDCTHPLRGQTVPLPDWNPEWLA